MTEIKSTIEFKKGSYIHILPVSRGQSKRTLKICTENHPIEYASDEYCNAVFNLLETIWKAEVREQI